MESNTTQGMGATPSMPKEKTLVDYASGKVVPATPEEEFATQPFSRILVEDYGYAKKDLITRPQHHVKKSPSDKKGYPVDIAVMEDGDVKIIVECKAPSITNLKEAEEQLKLYMTFSLHTTVGVVFNGSDSLYLHKLQTSDGIEFEYIPSIPRKGEKVSEMGKYRKRDLKPSHNLKSVFSEIRGWIVANGNVTRDEAIASQVVLLILCKIYDERYRPADELLHFRATSEDSDKEISDRIQNLFKSTQGKYSDVIQGSDKMELDGKTLRGVVGRLQNFSIIDTQRDAIADAFEVFIDKAVKDGQGQFFTPRNVIQVMIAAIDLHVNCHIIDSACGSGGFLVESLKRVDDLITQNAKVYGWTKSALDEEKSDFARKYLHGIEKDPFLTKLSKSYMAILGDGKGGIFQEDSLERPDKWEPLTQQNIRLGTFDFLLANPPFGKNIKVEGSDKLAQYSLTAKVDAKGKLVISKHGNVSSLFLERNLQFLKGGGEGHPGGKMGIILPEPYFALKSYSDEIDLMVKGNNIQWVIDLPHNTFRPHNNAKCCAIILQKDAPQQEYINMAVIENIGHNQQGKPVYDNEGNIVDDCDQVIREIHDRQAHDGELTLTTSRPLTFRVKAERVISRRVLVPRFYRDESQNYIELAAMLEGYRLVPIRDLLEDGTLSCFAGHGSPRAEEKGMGDIPYIRVKDIVNWQAYVNVTAMVSRDVYDRLFKEEKRLLPKDILYVSRGSYRIGSVAMYTPYDGDMLLTREIIVIRCDENNAHGITPEYLLFALSHKLVQEQTGNKVFYEPCLPNIGDRWKELSIPIPEDEAVFAKIKEELRSIVYGRLWEYKRLIKELKENRGAYMI